MESNRYFFLYILVSVLLLPFANIGMFLSEINDEIASIDLISFVQHLAICICVAVAEELLFRGLVLREMVFCYNLQPIRASLIVSIAFGILHLLNVNSYATWGYAIVQSICAFAVSFNICAVFINTKSLLWCIAIHAMINITSIGFEGSTKGQQLLLSNLESIIFLSVSFIYLMIGIKMLNNKMLEEK